LVVLETLIYAGLLAVGVSVCAHFIAHWAVHVRLRRVENELADLQVGLLSEKRRRAAEASVASRSGRAAAVDAAIVKAHTGVDISGGNGGEADPWWSGIVKDKGSGPP